MKHVQIAQVSYCVHFKRSFFYYQLNVTQKILQSFIVRLFIFPRKMTNLKHFKMILFKKNAQKVKSNNKI